eukprot:s100_g13.t4
MRVVGVSILGGCGTFISYQVLSSSELHRQLDMVSSDADDMGRRPSSQCVTPREGTGRSGNPHRANLRFSQSSQQSVPVPHKPYENLNQFMKGEALGPGLSGQSVKETEFENASTMLVTSNILGTTIAAALVCFYVALAFMMVFYQTTYSLMYCMLLTGESGDLSKSCELSPLSSSGQRRTALEASFESALEKGFESTASSVAADSELEGIRLGAMSDPPGGAEDDQLQRDMKALQEGIRLLFTNDFQKAEDTFRDGSKRDRPLPLANGTVRDTRGAFALIYTMVSFMFGLLSFANDQLDECLTRVWTAESLLLEDAPWVGQKMLLGMVYLIAGGAASRSKGQAEAQQALLFEMSDPDQPREKSTHPFLEQKFRLRTSSIDAQLQPDVVVYNSCISACGKGQQWENAMILLEELQSENVRPTQVTFNAALSACQKTGLWQLAIHLKVQMKESGLSPDMLSKNCLLGACACATRWIEALEIFAHGEPFGKAPSMCSVKQMWSVPPASSSHAVLPRSGRERCRCSNSWTSLQTFPRATPPSARSVGRGSGSMHCCCYRLPEVALVFNMTRKGLALRQADSISFNATIDTCEEPGQWQVAFQLLSTAQSARLADVVSFNSTISCCQTGTHWCLALALLSSLDSSDLRATVVSYSSTISAVGSEWHRAVQLVQQLRIAGLQCNVISQNAALSACEKGGEWCLATQLLCGFAAWRLRRSLVSFNAYGSACEKGAVWGRALDVHRGMQVNRMQPDDISFIATLGAAEKCCHWLQTLHLLPVLKEPDIGTCNCAISACKRSQRWQHAVEVRSVIAARRLRCDVITWSTLSNVLDAAGSTMELRRNLEELRRWARRGKMA